MRYVIKETNELVTLCRYWQGHDMLALSDTEKGQICGWYKITEIINEDANLEQYTLGEPTVSYDDIQYTATVEYALIERNPQDRLQRLAHERWIKCNQGVVYNEHKIDTSDISQARISSIITAYQSKVLVGDIQFKTKDGWLTLNEVSAFELAQTVANYIQDCFAWEKQHAELVAKN